MNGDKVLHSSQRVNTPVKLVRGNTPNKKLSVTGSGMGSSGMGTSGNKFYPPQENPPSSSQKNFYNPSTNPSSTNDFMLASLNIAVDETGFVSNSKADLFQLQKEIDQMDNDGKIRGINPSSLLKKNHISSMAKFLKTNANYDIRTLLDKRINHASTFNTQDLLNFMGVATESEGLRKLFKMLGILDLTLLKLTEFQIVSFLKYDQVFEGLRNKFGGQAPTKTATMDSGINISRFQVDLANMERMFDLYSFVAKAQQGKPSTAAGSRSSLESKESALSGVHSTDDLYKNLKKGQTFELSNSLAEDIINLVENSKSLEKELKDKKLTTFVEFPSSNDRPNSKETKREAQLKDRISQLESMLERKDAEIKKLQAEISKAKQTPQISSDSGKDEAFNAEYYIKMIKQIEDNYGLKYKDVEQDSHKKDQELITIKAKLEQIDRERGDLQETIRAKEIQEEKEARQRLKGDDGSFESALREQFASMKEGFELKLKNLTAEIQQVKKEKSLEVLEIKRELGREKENRELLLRKLQIYTKN